MYQLPLNITPRIPYTPDGFIIHEGVKTICDYCLNKTAIDSFRICVIYGEHLSGKTHLSIKLNDEFAKKGATPRLMDGISLDDFIMEQGLGAEYSNGTVIIIDNADSYLANLAPDRSGEFVNMVEALRRSKAALILLTGKQVSEFPIDAHVRSRLRPGEGFFISNPNEQEMYCLIDTISKQRGIKLTPKKINFIIKRIGRSIPSIVSALNTLLQKSKAGEDIDSFEALNYVISKQQGTIDPA